MGRTLCALLLAVAPMPALAVDEEAPKQTYPLGCDLQAKFVRYEDTPRSGTYSFHVMDPDGERPPHFNLAYGSGGVIKAAICEENGHVHVDMDVKHPGFDPEAPRRIGYNFECAEPAEWIQPCGKEKEIRLYTAPEE